jgi:nucleoside-diphosphate-sugar epimerase
MLEANVGVTRRMLDAAATAGIDRLVDISTVNVFGNTRGRIVDERFRRDIGEGFLSYYDETKFLAHRAVEERMAAGAPVIIVMPGVTYGPGDHAASGEQLRGAYDGSLRYIASGDTGISAAHVDDVAAGIVAALDRGRVGESYVLAGENLRLIDALRVAARLGGRSLPRLTMPASLVRLSARTPAVLARAVGLPDDLGEVVRASLGVTYWASSAKAATELGYVPRDLASGLRSTFGDG